MRYCVEFKKTTTECELAVEQINYVPISLPS